MLILEIKLAKFQEEKIKGLLIANTTRKASLSRTKEVTPQAATTFPISTFFPHINIREEKLTMKGRQNYANIRDKTSKISRRKNKRIINS
jgi:hypothetical protein